MKCMIDTLVSNTFLYAPNQQRHFLISDFPQWVLITWAAWEVWTFPGTTPAGASSSTIWARKQTRASCGRCLVPSVPSPTSRLSEISTPTSARASALLPWQTTRKQLWLSPAWMGTDSEIKYCKCPSKLARAISKTSWTLGCIEVQKIICVRLLFFKKEKR